MVNLKKATSISTSCEECMHNIKMAMARTIAYQQQTLVDLGLDSSHMVGFESNGQWIINPWADCTGRFSVEPIAEYGLEFLTSKFYNGGRIA